MTRAEVNVLVIEPIRYCRSPSAAGGPSPTRVVPTPTVETVAVTVAPVNDDPVAADDTATTDEDVPVTIEVLANDTDVDGNGLTVTAIATAPLSGAAVINGDDTVTYTPATDFFGVDEFEYEISDGNGGTTTAWVRFVVVNPVNDAPVADDDSATVDEDGAVTVTVLTGDTDVENDPLSVTAVSAPADGVVTINGDNTVTYTPDPDYWGPDSFSYTVCDDGGLCDTATVSVTVDPVNDEPVAGDDNAVGPEDGEVTIVVLDDDTDAENDSLNVTAVSDPPNGTVVVNGDNTVTYVPDPGYFGPDSFTYTVSDGNGGFDTATVAVTVVAVNDPPTASDLNPTTIEDEPVTIDVLGPAGDPEGDPLTVTATSSPGTGTVIINGDGTVTYLPDPDAFGTDTFTVTVCDPAGLCDLATVTVTIAPVNDEPVAIDDGITVLEDTPALVPVLDNDRDVDGDELRIVSVSDSPHGTTSIEGDVVIFTPDPDFFGTAEITYTVGDGNGGTTTATVIIVVEPVNDPLAYTGPTTVVVGVSGAPDPLPPVDAEGDPLTYTVIGGALPPELFLNPDGTWSGAADEGTYTVTIEACDDQAPPACSTLTLVLQLSRLAATGIEAVAMARAAVVLLLVGFALTRLPARGGRGLSPAAARRDRPERRCRR